ncbi:MAG: ABC-F family ATP-binding cassette domain-containing protein [Chlamydiales bacterium]|jgi:ATP-binding cassette subfamily F protein uup|nr:ABC-F family ATP-binding cassette domain-containing protein [Chlamydiales bacterium]
MALLLSSQSLSKSFGTKTLFTDLSISIFTKDRLGLIGPNGSGKSTFLKILTGIENSDSGEVTSKKGLKIGYVPQSCEFPSIPVEQVLMNALSKEYLTDYDKQLLIETWLSKMEFNKKKHPAAAALLSGGWKKRLSVVQQLILSPDLLLLDEPTNHLDLEGILWLEKLLMKEVSSYVLVSHDRYFLQNVVNRLIEINSTYPKGMFAIDGSYANFLEKKEQFLQGQIQQERSLASKARREEHWLRQTPKARTTKAQSRIDTANEVLQNLTLVQDRNRQKKTDLCFSATQRETNKLLVAKNLSKKMGGKILFEHVDFTLSPKTRIGLMGPNGSGKTTLLRILAKELFPDFGTIKEADGIKIVYFDQHKTQIPDYVTLKEALSPNGDYISFRGQWIHVNGWCKRFLFSPDLLNMPIDSLSGGEKARISIAHLMLKQADILLLDEPTNDLDIPTLESLEESLMDFPGAIVLITHDRCMLDRVCNCLLSLGDPNQTTLYPDYAQWQTAQKNSILKSKENKQPFISKSKLSYLEQKEYQQIGKKIEILEEEMKQLYPLLETTTDTNNLTEICMTISLKENQIEQLYIRWQVLEQKNKTWKSHI